MTRPSMEIEVSFLAGTDIADAIQQSIDLLQIMPMLAYVKFDFNELSVAVNRNSKVTGNIDERLGKAYKGKFKHWIVEGE